MKYAIVDGNKTEASPKAKGICPHCHSEMIAKCGRVNVWHWAHKGNPICDPWWENETEWHRDWKNQFPKEWQEISHIDPASGEQHIADVKNPFGLVIEFQHSTMRPEERISRENFYKTMVWVVDGTRGELDENYFNMGLSGPIQRKPLSYQVTWWGRSRLLHNWCNSKVKVYIDFGKDVLWRLILFNETKKVAAVGPLPKSSFIEDCHKGIDVSVAELLEEKLGNDGIIKLKKLHENT
jgi:ssDNA-binding Zn-finger/Zn-ribbon topoisomerase 1